MAGGGGQNCGYSQTARLTFKGLVMDEDIQVLSIDQQKALSILHKSSGGPVDVSVITELEQLGLVSSDWRLTAAGEKAHLAIKDGLVMPSKKGFFGKR
jgi:hypothetical protein